MIPLIVMGKSYCCAAAGHDRLCSSSMGPNKWCILSAVRVVVLL